MKTKLKLFMATLAGLVLVPSMAIAATATKVATPENTQGFSTADTRPGGTVTYVNDANAPFGQGALQLTTENTPTAKAQYLKSSNILLKDVGTLSYYTKQTSASFEGGLPSYQLPVCLYGQATPTTCATGGSTPTSGFTTLVYEPYVSEGNAAVQDNVWQKWNVSNGKFYSTRSVGSLQESSGDPTKTYTLAQIKQEFPNAQLFGFGVNIGSGNPNYVVQTDGIEFAGVVYDFEKSYGPPTKASQCKNDGYKDFNNPTFENQGQCVKAVRAGQNNGGNNNTTTNNNNSTINNSNSQTARSGNANSNNNRDDASATSGNARNNNRTNGNISVSNF